ncbi:MAG: peptidoglycan-binding protein [Clostridia bacterium]|nr:peptidoglycan-binding protein [Clostridia bacterium]
MANDMNMGTFFLHVDRKNGNTPVCGASVQTAHAGRAVSGAYTDIRGDARLALPAHSYAASRRPDSAEAPYTTYDVRVSMPGYVPLIIRGVQIFPGVTTVQKCTLTRTCDDPNNRVRIIDIPPHALYGARDKNAMGAALQTAIYPSAREVLIPQNITVHLGAPDSKAPDVTVPYTEYLKSVAASEIYPTWPESALRANLLAQNTLALNRIYTEWYRSQGYGFDITNSPAYDQAYIHNRATFEVTDDLVDETFTEYIARPTSLAPVFSRYCDGYISQCEGLSQWGSVDLAEQYYTPLDILRYYYGDDVFTKEASVVEAIPGSFPGVLQTGSESESVARLQYRLNRIAIDYPAIPFIEKADGVYDAQTVNAVKEFQRIFGLPVTGRTDEETWYRVIYIYTAVKKLAETESENFTVVNEGFPGRDLDIGMRGLDVLRMEIYLRQISAYFGADTIPPVTVNGVYDEDTRRAVSAFQRFYGIDVSGKVDEPTWNAVVSVYYDVAEELPPSLPPYPGRPVKAGSTGEDVKFIQNALNSIRRGVKEIPPLDVDGMYGPKTENAVKAFQKYYGLVPDGIVGPLTWARLGAEYSNSGGPDDAG